MSLFSRRFIVLLWDNLCFQKHWFNHNLHSSFLTQQVDLKASWERHPRDKSPRNGFPFSPASRSDCQSSSSSQGWKCLVPSFNSVFFFRTNSSPVLCSGCTALLWQRGCGVVMAAGWTAQLCAGEKDSLSERHGERERERETQQLGTEPPPPAHTHTHTPSGLSYTTQTLGTPKISHPSPTFTSEPTYLHCSHLCKVTILNTANRKMELKDQWGLVEVVAHVCAWEKEETGIWMRSHSTWSMKGGSFA